MTNDVAYAATNLGFPVKCTLICILIYENQNRKRDWVFWNWRRTVFDRCLKVFDVLLDCFVGKIGIFFMKLFRAFVDMWDRVLGFDWCTCRLMC